MTLSKELLKSSMPPPLPCLLGVLGGWACDWIWPWPIASYPLALAAGALLIAMVVALSFASAKAFKHHNTPADPARETTAVIDTGPFRYSRNPAYLAAVLLQAGIGCWLNTVWILIAVLPALIAIHYIVVIREEHYLEARFGAEYLDYKIRVRRWI